MFAKPLKSKLSKDSIILNSNPNKLLTQSSPYRATYSKYQQDSQHLNNNFDAHVANNQLNVSVSAEKRIEKLEERISMIQCQCDQLAPLLTLRDQTSSLSRADSQLRKLSKKQVETDELMNQCSTQLIKLNRSVDVLKNQYISSIPPPSLNKKEAFHKAQSSDPSHLNNLNIHNSLAFIPLEQETYINQIVQASSKNILESLQMNIFDLKDELTSKIKFQMKVFDECSQKQQQDISQLQQALYSLQNNNQQAIMNRRAKSEDVQAISDLTKFSDINVSDKISTLRSECEKELFALWREIGTVIVKQELTTDRRRKDKASSAFFVTDSLDKFERLLKLNNIEQSILIEELETFNKDNCQRLINDLRIMQEKLDLKNERLQNQRRWPGQQIGECTTRNEINIMQDQLQNLKNQIEGTRKISVNELRRIEDKMGQIDCIRAKISNDPTEKKDMQRFTQDVKKAASFADKISRLIEQIDENMKIVAEFIQKVENKLWLLSDQVNKE